MNRHTNTTESLDYSIKLTAIDWEGPISAALFLRLAQARWTEPQIKGSILLPRLENETDLEHHLRQIPARVLLLKSLHLYSKFGPERAFEMFHEECRDYIESKIRSHLNALLQTIQLGNLVFVPVLIDHTIRQISQELPFKWLSTEESYPLLAPFFVKKQRIETFILMVDNAILNVCEKINPGVNVHEIVHEALSKAPALLRTLTEIRPITVVKYLDRPEVVNFIHQKIIRTKANYCLAHLKPTETDLGWVRQSLQKIKVCRVRRNVIEMLYNDVKVTILTRYITAEQERLLLFLQEEFLRTLSFEIRKVDNIDIKYFLQSFMSHPVLQPLPPRSLLKGKNSRAQKALETLIENEGVLVNDCQSDELVTQDLHSPIEMDVLSEMIRELVELTTHSEEDLKDVLMPLKLMESTYQSIQSVYFVPEPMLIDLIEQEPKYTIIREKIMQEPTLFVRRFMLSDLYNMAKLRLLDKASKLKKLREFLLALYFTVLEEELEKTIIENDRERYLCYKSIIQPACHTQLLKDAMPDPATSRCYDIALKLILSK